MLGRGTRLAQIFQASDKEYLAGIRLGVQTDTYDAEGEVLERCPVPSLTGGLVEEALDGLRGKIDQKVPMFSAVRIDGERLYKAARRKQPRDRPTRTVEVFRLDLVGLGEDTVEIRVHCSAGTYIRSLAFELGRKLGCGAHLASLRRIRSGEFTIDEAVPLQMVEESWKERSRPLDTLLTDFPAVEVGERSANRVRNGNRIDLSLPDSDRCRIMFRNRLIAVGHIEKSILVPTIVLQPAG
jgi:tRNA pseudouridine55 synthase